MALHTWMSRCLIIFLISVSHKSVEGCSSSEMKNLTRTVGGYINLLADCRMQSGYLKFNRMTVASVEEAEMKPGHQENIQWNSTGCFTLTHLQLNHSGVYHVESIEPACHTFYNLTVYESSPSNNSTSITPSIVTIIIGLISVIGFILYKNRRSSHDAGSPSH